MGPDFFRLENWKVDHELQTIKAGWWCNNHLEQYEFVIGKDYPIYEMENKKWLKPPTSDC